MNSALSGSPLSSHQSANTRRGASSSGLATTSLRIASRSLTPHLLVLDRLARQRRLQQAEDPMFERRLGAAHEPRQHPQPRAYADLPADPDLVGVEQQRQPDAQRPGDGPRQPAQAPGQAVALEDEVIEGD